MKPTLLIGCWVSLLGVTLMLSGCQSSKPLDETPGRELKKPVSSLIQLSPEAVKQNHLQLVTVSLKRAGQTLTTTAAVQADENRLFHINTFVAGRVVQDRVILGQAVQKGQVLAVIQNLEVARIQANYIHELHQNEVAVRQAKLRDIQARRSYEREKRLVAEGISPKKDFFQAQTDAELAQSELEGQKEHGIHIRSEGRALLGAYNMRPQGEHLESIPTGSPLLAPHSGIITQKTITVGDMVTPDTALYEISDLSRVWLDLTLYPKDLPLLHPGLGVAFKSDSLPGKTFNGKIDYIQPTATEASATFVARAFLLNPQGLLKPGMFGQATIAQPEPVARPFLPEAAIQRYGKETFVFVVLNPGTYKKAAVQLGTEVPGGYRIEQGVQPGDKVVSQGSFTLKAALLKNEFAEQE